VGTVLAPLYPVRRDAIKKAVGLPKDLKPNRKRLVAKFPGSEYFSVISGAHSKLITEYVAQRRHGGEDSTVDKSPTMSS
jgi:hypothetical protein